MKSVVVILTVLGCDCNGVACEYIGTISSNWGSIESCEASNDFGRVTTGSVSYPLVVAQCSVDGGTSESPEIASSGNTDAGSGRQFVHGDAKPGETSWPAGGSSLRQRVASGAVDSLRAAGSSLKIYAGEPVRSFAGRVLAGLR